MLHVPHLSSFWMLLFSLLCFPQNTHTFYLHILIIWCLLTKLASWSITKLVQSVSERQNAWVTAHPPTLLCFLPLNLLWILSTPIFCSLILAWEVFFHLFTFNLTFSYPSVQSSRSVVSDSATPWIAAHQASLSITNSQSLLTLMSIELVMLSCRLILCRPLLLLPPTPPSIRVFSNESTLHMRWPKYWSFICPYIVFKACCFQVS